MEKIGTVSFLSSLKISRMDIGAGAVWMESIAATPDKSLLAEYQPKHFSARAVYRERKKLCEQIDSSMLAVPPTGSIKEEQQCSTWKQLLAFEKGNPQMLNANSLTKRVAFTVEQVLLFLSLIIT
ncbi:hypothetical protein GOP47_0008455 [Adiantum capillus-veneris]|uniref:Suppressor of forked domain-containing protein n=1 Tax=Adiantum capillus-veneris TaxID=13818 RepID=A0A9D4ZKQ6_ADICA|nr:hypothetical protein GOP47_0008455 [Adiantum capillus-veneris]